MISLSTADSALKNVYLEAISNQLNKNIDPFFAKIGATSQDVAGNEVKKLVSLGINGGIGAGTEIGALPTSRENNYVSLTSKLKNLYGTIEISDKALRASRDEAGAFLNLLNAEMENLIESSKFNLRRMVYGYGNGFIGKISEGVVGSKEYFVYNAGPFVVGMRLRGRLYDENIDFLNNATVIDVNYETNIITLDVEFPEEYDGEADFELYLYDSAEGYEPLGIRGLCDSDITNVYGIDRTTTSAFTPATAKADYTIPTLMKIIDDTRINTNSETDFILCSYFFRRQIQNLLKAQSMNTDILDLEGGFKSISFAGIPVVASRFVDEKYGFFVDSSVWHLHQLCDWTWLTNNKGEVLHQREGYPTHLATLVKYCDLICDRPTTITQAVWS
ncbi:MAG: phage major capsid protein [Clostridia bacterium]|nr:phage major capsid protein [Clostridia bacterium]